MDEIAPKLYRHNRENAFSEARSYHEKKGHLNVLAECWMESGFALGTWLNNRRQKAYYEQNGDLDIPYTC